jgi:hypothetical protein
MLTAVARCALWVLLAAISSGPALAEVGGEGPAAPAAAAPDTNAVFPSAVDPKYAQEDPVMARMHTCVDQYNNNKATNANGGLKWIQKGGGYYSECFKRPPGISSDPALARDRGEKPELKTVDSMSEPSLPARYPEMIGVRIHATHCQLMSPERLKAVWRSPTARSCFP